MKNLDSARLKPYRIEDPPDMAIGFKTFFPGSKTYAFEFPMQENDVVLRTLISTYSFMGLESTRISTSIRDVVRDTITTAGIKEIYQMQEYIQKSDECMVWQYEPALEKLRASGVKTMMGVDFNLRHCATQFLQYSGKLPPLKVAYETEMKKDGEFVCARGSVGDWKFVHVKVDPGFPWDTLQKIAQKVFRNNLVLVFFNEETKKHSEELVLWYNPSMRPFI